MGRRVTTNTKCFKLLQYLAEKNAPIHLGQMSADLGWTRSQAGSAVCTLREQGQVKLVGFGYWQWTGDTNYLYNSDKQVTAERLLKLLAEHPQSKVDELAALLKTSRSGTQTALNQLLASGLAQRDKVFRNGRKTYLWTLTGASAPIVPTRKALTNAPTRKPTGAIPTATGTKFYMTNARHWSHDTVGCVVPLAKGYSGLEKL